MTVEQQERRGKEWEEKGGKAKRGRQEEQADTKTPTSGKRWLRKTRGGRIRQKRGGKGKKVKTW